jgi:hypothetical protein
MLKTTRFIARKYSPQFYRRAEVKIPKLYKRLLEDGTKIAYSELH